MASKPAKLATRARTPAPEILNEYDAAAYIGMSVSYLRADRWRGRVGASTPGPAYLRLGRTIRYRRDDLDSWLMERRVDRSAKQRPAPQPEAA
jgi:hypothetical protein